jgi:hypothetical protein
MVPPDKTLEHSIASHLDSESLGLALAELWSRRLVHRTQKHFNGNYENDPKNDVRCLRSIFHLVRR